MVTVSEFYVSGPKKDFVNRYDILNAGARAGMRFLGMGLLYGLGFPVFRGGPIRYLETLGLDNFIDHIVRGMFHEKLQFAEG